MDEAGAPGVTVAVGILSTLSAFSRRALSTGAHSFTRRMLVRNTTSGLRAPDVALRFLVARPAESQKGGRRGGGGDYRARLRDEHARYGDLVLLNMTEHFLMCPLKYLLWLRVAPTLFPSAKWVAAADDDIYLQLEHLSAELRLVSAMTNATTRPVLWGLITWKAFMNSATCACAPIPPNTLLGKDTAKFSFSRTQPPSSHLSPSRSRSLSSRSLSSLSLCVCVRGLSPQTTRRWDLLAGDTPIRSPRHAVAARTAASPTRPPPPPPHLLLPARRQQQPLAPAPSKRTPPAPPSRRPKYSTPLA
jgi:hypothetical protein